MHGDDALEGKFLWHGPKIWAASIVLGSLLGFGLTFILKPAYSDPSSPAPVVPLVLVVPFAGLLLAIATGPLVNPREWHRHFPDIAFFAGSCVAAYYLFGYTRPLSPGGLSYGADKVIHAGVEYFAFIALVGGLYIVSGGVLVEFRGRAGPLFNCIIFLAGAVLANIVGTTGASMLLIRPFMRANEGRLRPIHIVLFIFIVSNCGGCLTPIGDPPLYLGFIKGVPFFWTLTHLWREWAVVVSVLLVIAFAIDWTLDRRDAAAGKALPKPSLLPSVRVRGHSGIICLVLMVAAVFIDPVLNTLAPTWPHLPHGAGVQIIIAIIAYRLAPKDIHDANDFSFFPVKEVGLLFIGIFLTMIPALGYLSANGAKLGMDTPTEFYFGTGLLSGVLDNAPTYLNFLQVAVPGELSRESVRQLIADPAGTRLLVAISLGAVFFGAMTYIGNGPNFMVRTIAESAGVKMPSFFGYALLATLILLPVLVLNWWLFVR